MILYGDRLVSYLRRIGVLQAQCLFFMKRIVGFLRSVLLMSYVTYCGLFMSIHICFCLLLLEGLLEVFGGISFSGFLALGRFFSLFWG